jgi:hypothetical protein
LIILIMFVFNLAALHEGFFECPVEKCLCRSGS